MDVQLQARPVVLLCQTRTGSQHLKALLASVAGVEVLPQELFYPSLTPNTFYGFWAGRIADDPARAVVPGAIDDEVVAYLTHLLARSDAQRVVLDVKLHQLHELPALWPAVRGAVERLGGWAVQLVRENLLRSVVSERIMHRRLAMNAEPVHRDSTPEAMCVRLDPGWALAQLRQRSRRDRRVVAEFGPLESRFLRVAYESFEQPCDAPGVVAAIASFLGLDPPESPPTSDLARQNPGPLCDLVDNFEELSAALAPTRFAWMLDG